VSIESNAGKKKLLWMIFTHAPKPVPERDATWPSGRAADGVIMRRRDEENVGQVG
jgi:hypothetical protein